MHSLTLTRPDDWHLHLRDGDLLRAVLPHTAHVFARALVMPNLKPALTQTQAVMAYRERILSALPAGSAFVPEMALYLCDQTDAAQIRAAAHSGIRAAKLYPAGATTNSHEGVTALSGIAPALEAMQRAGMLLLLHGEATEPEIDIFDREAVFIERTLIPLRRDFPALKIVLEHITTREAVQFVQAAPSFLAATITAHHLLLNRNDLFSGGLNPHHYCLPILKAEAHRRALMQAAISGDPRFFLGSDSAPHPQSAKECATGCAGCFTAPAALPLYALVFERSGSLEKLEGFASFYGADFYGLPRNTGRLTLLREDWSVPAALDCASEVEPERGHETLVPFFARQKLPWRVA